MKLLHVDSGITGPGAVSRQLSAAVVAELKRAHPGLEVVHRDLDADPIPHLDSLNVASVRAAGEPGLDAEAVRAAEVLQEFLDADVVVVGAPMYNLGIPSQLKAWFDRVLVAGKTFRYTAEGPRGLAAGKKAIVASARGGLYAPGTPQASSDFHEPYLKALFGFVGIHDVSVLRAEGVAISPERRAAAIEAAIATVPGLAGEITPALAA
jgi:FMN-dependent NADH-azoreductase